MAPPRARTGLPLGKVLVIGGALFLIFLLYRHMHPPPPARPTASLPPEEIRALTGRQIALVAGHLGSDPGATCADGLTEQSVNRRIVEHAAEILRSVPAQVMVLQEYDPRLDGLQADVFLSVHADSCLPLSGFKVARWARSPHPARDDRLVRCLRYHYWLITGLSPDPEHVTEDMTEYHAFHRVAPDTPAAIIEVGYLGGDRELLTQRPDLPALGIVEGLACFLGGTP